MIKSEWKALLHNWVLLVVMISVITIPVIYAGFFLYSMWDPYGNMGELPVAVINNDVPAEYEDRVINIGDDLVEELMDNDSLDFRFDYTAEEAEKALKNGEIYMVITIPENFSANASTLMDEKPQRMIIDYDINPGTNYIASKFSQSAMVKLKASVNEAVVESYSEILFDSLTEIRDSMVDAADGSGELLDGVDEARDGVIDLDDGAHEMHDGTIDLLDGVGELKDGVYDYTDGVAQIYDAIPDLKSGIKKLDKGARQLEKGTDTLEEGINDYTAGANQITAGLTALKAALEDVDGLGAKLQTLATTLQNMMGLKSGLETASTALGQASDALAAGNNYITQAYSTLNFDYSGMSMEQITAVKTAQAYLASGAAVYVTGAKSGVDQVKAGIAQTAAAIPSAEVLSGSAVQLSAGAAQLQSAVDQLSAGAATLVSNNKKLQKGASDVENGMDKLYYHGTRILMDGADELADGVEELYSHNAELNDGTQELYDGSVDLEDGARQIADGTEELRDGMDEMLDGTTELHDGIQDGSDELNEKLEYVSDETDEFMSAPVDTNENMVTTVPNNGHAMAPYMMSVALWIGALAFCLIYPLTQYSGEYTSAFAWWASKATVLYATTVMQSLILVLVLHAVIDFRPARLGQTVAFAMLTALAFTSIQYFFNVFMGKVGSFMMLIFMVLQLAGSAGTYPVEISPKFVSVIHWLVPYTYTVNAFRSTIAGGESIRHSVVVLVGIIIVFSFLTIINFQIKSKRRKNDEFILYDWLEEEGLA